MSNESLLSIANSFVRKTLYQFSSCEEETLNYFFTNIDKRVFFMHTLPANVGAALIAMYSRMKNQRGLRGTFVDSFLPNLLASQSKIVAEKFGGDAMKALNSYAVNSLKSFTQRFPGGSDLLNEFTRSIHVDPFYLKKLSNGEKVKRFLSMWLDAYGHNSIARAGAIWICFENISILAAKSLEWGRPGAAYIELSTRYVDMKGKDCYPIHQELEFYGIEPWIIGEVVERSFEFYSRWQGDKFNGPFPEFLRQRYGNLYKDSPKDLESGIIGETCDVLGNFLPASTLTSVGVLVSGEAFPELLKHLMLDNTLENKALVQLAMEEAEKIGADQFAKHYMPTKWKEDSWKYLSLKRFSQYQGSGIIKASIVPCELTEGILLGAFHYRKEFNDCFTFEEVIEILKDIPRENHDKLWNEFEDISASCSGIMSFRGHRDLQRMGFSTHIRTFLTPNLGFYDYDKPAPDGFKKDCQSLWGVNNGIYEKMDQLNVPPELMQYPLALGNLIGFRSNANLLQWEFCNWQRSKFSVNHEVRQIFLGMEKKLRSVYPWWENISRADTTPAYVFARGSKNIPLAI